MTSILISLCLLGMQCRYDGKCKPCLSAFATLQQKFQLIPVCPEQLGGLPTPRPPAERRGDGVYTADSTDVTALYTSGAQQTLALAQRYGCRAAILKAKSPACGSGMIYDGSFTRHLIPGWGVTADLLRAHGLLVCDETEIDWLLTQLTDA